MDWVDEFYSVTGSWWGDAESGVRDVDRARADFVHTTAPTSGTVLELGCGYGSTALAIADTGRSVVGIDLSSRIERGLDLDLPPSVRLERCDFYAFDPGATFDVVCYWDGFGIGEDDDQLRLLRRIADRWLAPDGAAIIEVFHPSGWMADDGREEIKEPAPEAGYAKRLGHARRFDVERSRAIDVWWEVGSGSSTSDRRLEQSLRCYVPAEFTALVDAAGLSVAGFAASPFAPEPVPTVTEPAWSFLAVLRHSQRARR